MMPRANTPEAILDFPARFHASFRVCPATILVFPRMLSTQSIRGYSFMANQRAQLTGTNITGVSGAQHGRQKNAQAMQRAGAAGAAGAASSAGFEFGSELGASAGVSQTGANISGVSGAQHGAQKNAQAMQRLSRKGGSL
jgi:hypothetical protein